MADGTEVELKADPAGPLVAQDIQDAHRSVRATAELHAHLFRHAEKGRNRACLVGAQAGQDAPTAARAGKRDRAGRIGDRRRHRGGGQVRRSAHRDLPGRHYAAAHWHFPTPMVGLAVTPKTRGDEGKLSGALHKIVEEDGTLRLDHDQQTKELVMTGMSELHLQLLRERLKRRDKVEVEAKEPKIPYRETIQSNAEGSYRHKKQSGGRGQFGEVHIRVYPLPEGTKIEEYATKGRFPSMREYHYDAGHNFLWVDSIVGGTIPNNFLPAVEKGFKERLDRGVIAGFKVQNVTVEVFFGKHHPVDSSEAAFKTAGSMAFRNVFREARPALLEPIVKLHVTVPGNKLGDVNSDMSSRRGRPLGMDSAGGDLQTVTVEVPLAEVTTYARSLSSMTGGQGSYTMEFSHYDVVPPHTLKEIIEKAVLHEEEESEH